MPNSLQRSAIGSPASRRATNCSLSSITEHSFHGITSSPKKGKKRNPCVRYIRINNFIFSNSVKNANERLVQNHLLFVLSPLRERSFLLLIDRVGKNSGFIASVFDARLGTG